MQKDSRDYLRLPLQSRVFIELIAPEVGGGEPGNVIMCSSFNMSRAGLRVGLVHELLVGSILQIGVELPDLQDTLYLAGEVRWCLANHEPEAGWSAGFAILNAGDSDIDRWVALLADMES